jgi:tetratricopeptide (TPR) repeat protein
MMNATKDTRSPARRLLFFLLFALPCAVVGQAASEGPGWGRIWHERMTIGQAELDDAFRLAEKGRSAEALAIIDSVIARDPANWRPYFLKSAVLVLVKRGDEALKLIDTSIGLARKDKVSPAVLAELYASKARSCIDYGRYADAKRSLESALHLRPNDATTLNDLAWMLATAKDNRVRDVHRAVALATKACELDRWTNAYTIDTLAAAFAAAANFPDAVKYQQLAIAKLEPTDRKAQLAAMQQRLQQYSAHRVD